MARLTGMQKEEHGSRQTLPANEPLLEMLTWLGKIVTQPTPDRGSTVVAKSQTEKARFDDNHHQSLIAVLLEADCLSNQGKFHRQVLKR